MGDPPEIDTAVQPCAAAVRFFYPTADIAIEDVRLPRPAADYPGLVAFQSLVEPGQELRLPPREYLSRLAFAVVTGSDQDECAARLDAVEADLIVSGRPLGVEP